ncbi:MAG: hypothetical protein PUB76_09570 [Oscillospiraceae bacterium]|nr:hypothetical protein [Oscillospiraceae bacterium]MDY3258078.1 hypothetical protein [Ruminococcus callidus]
MNENKNTEMTTTPQTSTHYESYHFEYNTFSDFFSDLAAALRSIIW